MARRRRPSGRFLTQLARAVLVIPDAQRYSMDLAYEVYAFALFHQSVTNRALHAVGPPLAMADARRRRVAGVITIAAPPLTCRSFHRSLAGRRTGA